MGQPALNDDVCQDSRKAMRWSAAGASAILANPMQRILLVTDGTVTNVLEAYAREQIRVVKLRQVSEPAGQAAADLDVLESDQILHREVLLTGRSSGRIFVYALSQIVPARLDPRVRRGLTESLEPIGRLLEKNRVETFREILDARREPAGVRAVHFGIDRRAVLVSRTYRIIAGRQPVMLITEKFPADAFGD